MNLLSPPASASGAEYPIVVLLVDDQPLIGEAVRRQLVQQTDIALHYCARPLDAVEMANSIKPTVILQDLVMPDVDGLDLVQQFRANEPTSITPIIVLSTKEDAQIKGHAFEVGANDYLVKLPDKIELIARIRYHSRAYLNQLQRDEAYRALRASEQQLQESNMTLVALNQQLEAANHKISQMARCDALTGLVNRRVLDEELQQETQRCERQGGTLTAIILDIDHFKSVNDTFGHATGDEVLRAVGHFLSEELRPYDVAARYGGEEFVILLSETDIESGLVTAERLRHGLSTLSISNYPHRITASFGVATWTSAQSPYHIIERADTALYRAKQNGRNRVERAEA